MRVLTALALMGLLFGSHVFAAGHGGGQTKIDIQFDSVTTTKSRLFGKFDIDPAALALLVNTGSKSHNDDLAAWTLTLTVGGSSTFSALCDSKGKTKEDLDATVPVPFTAKLTANGKNLQILATGMNLGTLLGINAANGDGSVTVQIDVSASKTDVNQVTTTVPLSSQMVTFKYQVKNTTVKGSNH